MTNYKVYFDGCCDNRSRFKLMGFGVAFQIGDDFLDINHAGFGGTNGTSNIAEYMALIQALKMCCEVNENKPSYFRLYGDSQLVINQINGDWAVKSEHLVPYHKEARLLADTLGDNLRSIGWIRRIYNKEADKYSKLGVKNWMDANNLLV